jgi:hypothetical protein
MTALSVGQIQGLFPANQIVIDKNAKLIIQGILRISTIQNSSGFTTLSSTSAGVVTLSGNLTTSSTLTCGTISPSRLVVPIWTTATRPNTPSTGTMGYNSTLGRLENFTGTQWESIINSLTI